MKIANHVVELSFRSRQPWTHFKILKHNWYTAGPWRHLVWGKVSLLWGQPHLAEIEVHKDCGAEVRGIGEDSISFCTECEHIVEGDTEMITVEEFENR